jgi:hypothetical protein
MLVAEAQEKEMPLVVMLSVVSAAEVLVIQLQLTLDKVVQQILVVAVEAAVEAAAPVAQAVQALSFFATPAQFNISLVAQ